MQLPSPRFWSHVVRALYLPLGSWVSTDRQRMRNQIDHIVISSRIKRSFEYTYERFSRGIAFGCVLYSQLLRRFKIFDPQGRPLTWSSSARFLLLEAKFEKWPLLLVESCKSCHEVLSMNRQVAHRHTVQKCDDWNGIRRWSENYRKGMESTKMGELS